MPTYRTHGCKNGIYCSTYIVKENDIGVTISADMKVSEQCGVAASKGNQILGLIRRTITYKKKLILPLDKEIVIYCIQAWRPYRKKYIDTLERIQRRATKIIPELRDLSYEEHLKECGLTTLEKGRLRGDQTEVFKLLSGYENITLVKDQEVLVLTEDNKCMEQIVYRLCNC